MNAETSVAVASERLLQAGLPCLPVVKDGLCIGTLDETSMLAAFVGTAPEDAAIEPFVRPLGATVRPYATGAECLRTMESSRQPHVVVVDDRGWPLGVLTASRLFGTIEEDNRPRLVGGMATPFGVYLTNGTVTGGVSQWALVGTGAMMFFFLALGMVMAKGLQLAVPASVAKSMWFDIGANVLVLAVFVIGLRLSGLTGFHGAEHKTVNAIEQGEPLTLDSVARMSRIHPRCGTNLAVAASLFFAIFSIPWVADAQVRGLLAGFITFFTWRPLGSMAQRFVTTTSPNAVQLQRGLDAANDLVRNYQRLGDHQSSIPRSMWNSGLLQIMAGSLAMHLLIWGIMTVLNVPAPWRDIIGI